VTELLNSQLALLSPTKVAYPVTLSHL